MLDVINISTAVLALCLSVHYAGHFCYTYKSFCDLFVWVIMNLKIINSLRQKKKEYIIKMCVYNNSNMDLDLFLFMDLAV